MATFEEQYQKYNNTAQGQAINQMYDAQKNSQLAQMENAYQQSKAEHEAVAKKIPTTYQASANDLAANYERQRRNFNQQAAASGINTGTGAQAALAQNAAYQRNLAGIRTAEADAQSEADRSLANLEATYKANVQSAIADNDYKRAAALLNEYKDAEARDLNKAQTLAAYGDFSGYAALYGQDIANNMAALWKASNPDLAYRTGQMSAEEYKAMTGNYPAGYEAPRRYYNPSPNPSANPTGTTDGTTLSGMEGPGVIPLDSNGMPLNTISYTTDGINKWTGTPYTETNYLLGDGVVETFRQNASAEEKQQYYADKLGGYLDYNGNWVEGTPTVKKQEQTIDAVTGGYTGAPLTFAGNSNSKNKIIDATSGAKK